jgi:hypothetical protein
MESVDRKKTEGRPQRVATKMRFPRGTWLAVLLLLSILLWAGMLLLIMNR